MVREESYANAGFSTSNARRDVAVASANTNSSQRNANSMAGGGDAMNAATESSVSQAKRNQKPKVVHNARGRASSSGGQSSSRVDVRQHKQPIADGMAQLVMPPNYNHNSISISSQHDPTIQARRFIDTSSANHSTITSNPAPIYSPHLNNYPSPGALMGLGQSLHNM